MPVVSKTVMVVSKVVSSSKANELLPVFLCWPKYQSVQSEIHLMLFFYISLLIGEAVTAHRHDGEGSGEVGGVFKHSL